jgi:hypothetical protein
MEAPPRSMTMSSVEIEMRKYPGRPYAEPPTAATKDKPLRQKQSSKALISLIFYVSNRSCGGLDRQANLARASPYFTEAKISFGNKVSSDQTH